MMNARGWMWTLGAVLLGGVALSCGDYAHELAEDACNREVDCEHIDADEYDECVDEVELELKRTENAGFACRDAARGFVECGITLECGVDPEDGCSEEHEMAEQACDIEVNLPWY